MKSLFTTLFILLSFAGFGQTLTGISFYDLEMNQYIIGNPVNPTYMGGIKNIPSKSVK
jgi:hypothetical protein